MKILIDENIDIRFKNFFPVNSHEVYTVRDMQWNGADEQELFSITTI
jgi:predicted nuclease of predicted toxin-antitoxin system